ncbi:MAG: D-alanine--D-alanine ligase [Eubacterium sp.]|nr:D-alanine--D-alanine ligase [Eubacterium sp.]
MDIVVLAGGLSAERDVSLKTGDMVAGALRRNGHRVILADVFMGYKEKEEDISDLFAQSEQVSITITDISETAPDLARIRAMRKDQSDCFFGPNIIRMCQMADIVFLALHGENGENGKIQAAFDLLGIRYTGSGYLSSALAMDKGIAKLFFREAGVPTPKGIKLSKAEWNDRFQKEKLTVPCVVKPCCGGSSIGVSIVQDPEEFEAALKQAFLWEEEVIIEDYIKGREFSVAVIAGRALPVIEMAPIEGFYDYKNKYKSGSAIETCPAQIPEAITHKMQEIAVAAANALGIDTYSRMDFMLSESGEIFCLEANTLPGMTPTSLIPQEAQAAGMDFCSLCEWLVQISLQKYEG